jgi:hypothetical protein
MDKNLDELLENESLKKEFVLRNLDLSQVFTSTPEDLEYENLRLRYLLDWVEKYNELGNRQMMEAAGYEFPPIVPCISPENDWYMFERWINGLPIRKKMKELLPSNYILKNPEDLNDEEILAELKKLTEILEEYGISVALVNEIPPRLIYIYLVETLNAEQELLIEGGWNLDGCTGYCPGCFQRPWCEQGNSSCWNEDEEAGEIFLIDSAKKYVSASPVSLRILQKLQAEEDERFKKFEQNFGIDQNNNDVSFDDLNSFEPDDEDGIPF